MGSGCDGIGSADGHAAQCKIQLTLATSLRLFARQCGSRADSWPNRCHWKTVSDKLAGTSSQFDPATSSSSRLGMIRRSGKGPQITGAGEGNRTLVSGLGSPHSTIEPHPHSDRLCIANVASPFKEEMKPVEA